MLQFPDKTGKFSRMNEMSESLNGSLNPGSSSSEEQEYDQSGLRQVVDVYSKVSFAQKGKQSDQDSSSGDHEQPTGCLMCFNDVRRSQRYFRGNINVVSGCFTLIERHTSDGFFVVGLQTQVCFAASLTSSHKCTNTGVKSVFIYTDISAEG